MRYWSSKVNIVINGSPISPGLSDVRTLSFLPTDFTMTAQNDHKSGINVSEGYIVLRQDHLTPNLTRPIGPLDVVGNAIYDLPQH